MKIFFDNNLPPRLAHGLQALEGANGYKFVHLRDRFEASAQDELWIPTLAAEGGWVVITKDTNILKNPQQRVIWRNSKLTTFFLKKGWYNHPFREIYKSFFSHFEEIARLAKRYPGEGFILPFKGKKISRVKY